MMAKIFALTFLPAGLGLIVLGIVRHKEATASRAWTEVAAKVESAETGKTRKKGRDDNFHARITYRYEVQGVSYTSQRVGLTGQESSSKSDVQKLLKQYMPGSTVKAYYDPARPEHAVLIRGVSANIGVLYMVGAAFLGIGGYLTLRGVPRFVSGSKPASTSVS